MALKISWTPNAIKGLYKVLDYLEENWTSAEILNLENKIKSSIELIKNNPDIFPKSTIYNQLHKVIVDKNNYFTYRIRKTSDVTIVITSFRGTKQRRKH